MIASPTIECAYCRCSIVPGQKWVRQKIYEPALNGREPRYHRYHAELFTGEDQSCWEKHQLYQEPTGTTAYAA